ncbi:MAG: phosphoglucomutase/phosphomannomutase family protein [Natronomonas sp.]
MGEDEQGENGGDGRFDGVRFGTDGWRVPVSEFTTPRIRAIGQAVVDYLRAEDEEAPVAVGYDPRAGSRAAAEELSRVLCAGGFEVVFTERDTPTPVVARSILRRGLSGGLQVTASHNPPTDNGIKFLTSDGAPAPTAVMDDIGERLRPPDPVDETRGTVTETDLIGVYLDEAEAFLEADLSGLTVAYDAMHGSGRGVTDALLSRLGAEVIRLRSDRDPEFGGVRPEPIEEHLGTLREVVVDGDADLGVANDGDADRLGVVSSAGFVDPNLLFALLYDHLLDGDTGGVVRTVSTTFLIDRIAAARGETVRETPVGFKHVAAAMAESDALVGGEESGGFGLRGHVRNKDGVLTAALVAAAETGESLDDRIDRLRAEHGAVVQSRRSIRCPEDRKAAALSGLEAAIPETIAGVEIDDVVTLDGFKLLCVDGSWLLVRPSGTEPKLRLYAEGATEARVEALLDEGESLLEAVT